LASKDLDRSKVGESDIHWKDLGEKGVGEKGKRVKRDG